MKARYLAALLLILPVLCFADTQTDLKNLMNTISAQEKELQALEKSQSNITKQISLIQKNQADIKRALSVTQTQIANNKNTISRLEKEVVELERASLQYQKQAGQAMVFMLDNSGTLTARAVLAGNDSRQTSTNIELLSELNIKLVERINEYKEAVIKAEEAKTRLGEANALLETAQQENRRLISEFHKNNDSLTRKLTVVKQDAKAKEDYLDMLYEEQERLNNLIKGIKTPKIAATSAFAKNKGSLPRPVTGKVIENYGKKLVPEVGIEIMNKGIKIRPDKNSDVKTVFDGTVVFVDNIAGLGNIVIIQHDKEYFTVYSNLNDYCVKNADELKQNDTLGRINVDLKGNSSYLYFEIRKHDVALNPNQWLKK